MGSYTNFKELAADEREGHDFRIRIELRNPRVLIMAPHGGKIEPATAEIAEAIAGLDYSFYSLEALKTDSRMLHIESHLFDEPRALQAAREADVVITVHGQLSRNEEFVMVGGLNESLRSEIIKKLEGAGFQTRPPTEGLAGTDPMNICNRGRLKQGIQLEISRKIRDSLRHDRDFFRLFSESVRKAIQQYLSVQQG